MARARPRKRRSDHLRTSCYVSTPTGEKARGRAFYTWMFAGHALYAALAEHYPIHSDQLSALSGRRSARVAIETFPHAVACALAGGHVSAKGKLAIRTQLLRAAGIDTSALKNIDEVDAALCALAAQHFAAGTFKAYGDAIGGYIIVPRDPLPGPFNLGARTLNQANVAKRRLAAAFNKTTALGFRNRNGQVVDQHTRIPGNDHNQFVYVLKCEHCSTRYGANGSDIFQRKCPKCQDGRPGLAFSDRCSALR